MVGFNGNFLFDKRWNGFLTKMDDSTSMVSLALRDGLESSGRTVMEYKRDKHGGRERLIEEGATMLIWAFGINWMKNLYDWGAKDVLKKIDLPDLNTALLKRAQQPGEKTGVKGFLELLNPPSAQTLVDSSGKKLSGAAENFTSKFKNIEAYQHLGKIAKSQGAKYAMSNMGKFVFATGIPVTAIAFGIPSFNQWLTRKKIDQEQKKPSTQNNKSLSPQSINTQAAPSFPGKPGQPVNTFTGFQPRQNNPYAFSSRPRNAFSTSQFGSQVKSGKGKVQFGGNPLGDAAAAFLQNERMNTLLVDGVISGGRVYKSRNWQERAEIMFREGSIIAFLYFGQRILQNAFTKAFKGGSDLNFDTTRFLNSVYGKADDKKAFFEDFARDRKKFQSLLGHDLNNFASTQAEKEGSKFWKNLLTQDGRKKIKAAQVSAYQVEDKLVKQIQDYFVENQSKNTHHNLIFETAKECGWIPTFDGKKTPSKGMIQTISETGKNTVVKLKETAQFLIKPGEDTLKTGPDRYFSQGAAGKALNITKKIDTESILSFVKNMDGVIQHNAEKKAPEAVEQLMKRAISRRGWAWFASNAVCTVFLSYLLPKAQHYLTYRMTGKDYFPGVQPSA